jgi:hypothetical protein
MNEGDGRGQEAVQSIPDNGMGLPSADLHNGPGMAGDPMDFFGKRVHGFRISKFIHVFHGRGLSFVGSRLSWAIIDNDSFAACSFTWLIANPTWTIT